MPRKKTPSEWPKGLDQEQKTLLAIGHLVAITATCEHFFLAILECVIGTEGKRHHEIIWLSHRNTSARISMVLRVAKINGLPPPLLKEVERCAVLFNGIKKLRNFYSHARYLNLTLEGGPVVFEGYELQDYERDDGADLVKVTTKPIKRRSINELANTIERADKLWDQMIDVAHRVRSHTGALHVPVPPRSDT
jgi:hypothetical protein